MSASVLAGHSALGISAAPPRAGSAKATTSEASGESAFQLAVGSAGEEGRRTTEQLPSPSTEEKDDTMRRTAKGNETGQRLQIWMSGMESGPVAGDLLLSGGALTSENGQPSLIVGDGSVNPQATAESDVLASVEHDVRRLAALAVHDAETSAEPGTAEATASMEGPASQEAQVPPTRPIRDGAGDKGIQVLDREKHPAQSVDVGIGNAATKADGVVKRLDHVDPGTPTRPGFSKPVPAADVEPVQTVSTTVSLLTQPHHPPADNRVARDETPAAYTFDQPRLNLDEALRPSSVEPAITSTKAQEAAVVGGPDASAAIRHPQPVTVSPARQADTPGFSQTVAMIAKPMTGIAKPDVAQDGERGAERTDLNTRLGAARKVEGLQQPRAEGADRQQPARFVNNEQPSTPIDASTRMAANARDATLAQTAAPQGQLPAVTVVESRQYLGAAPQQANAEAITRAVSGNDAWSAVLRNESAIHSSAPLQTLKIRLNPAELGMVDATLRLSGDKLVVELNVQTTEAYRQLSDNRQSVLNALRGQGYGVETLSVQLSPSDRNGQQGTSSGQQLGGFDGQPAQDSFRQSGEGGRFGQENRNDDGHRANTTGRGETSPDGSALPPGNTDGAVYL